MAPIIRYNPRLALAGVVDAREVQVEMARLGLRASPAFSEGLVQEPMRGVPHLPPVMKNVTVEQVLSSTAVTFKGVVVYGTCTQPNGKGLLDLNFVWLNGTGK
jgi:hypothetical protein